jgi:alpha-amylase/alpha-mannosidase (GH57 family)
MMRSAEGWLDNEDEQCRDGRLSRLKWIIEEYPNIEISLFYGAPKSHYLFEEARYCFVYGQYIASIMLSLSYIENSLASAFYASGRNNLQRVSMVSLLEEAKEKGLISESEFDVFNKVREIRNPITHFRKPVDKEAIEYMAVKGARHPYEVLEEDAKAALKAAFRMMAKFSIPKHED